MKSYLLFLTALFATSFLLAQKVGINTSTPEATLDVNGTLKVGSLGGPTTQMVVSDSSGNLSVQAIPTIVTYSAGSGITINAGIISNSEPDQPISLTGSGATIVSGSYPNFVITSTDMVNDADANPANELQTLSLSGSTLSISTGNSIDLSSLAGGSSTELADADGDTKVQVEESADEDKIRFDIAGTEKLNFSLNPNGEVQLKVSNPNGNLYLGNGAGSANLNTSFDANTFIGNNAGAANSFGDSNTFLGGSAGESNVDGYEAVFVGANAGGSNTSGIQNVFVGHNAGSSNTVGSGNVYLGEGTGFANDSGSNNIFIGQFAGASTGSNLLYIGGGVPLIYGEFDNDVVQINGDLGIGVKPDTRLHISGADNNGTTATLKITSGSQSLLLDGNEIDVDNGNMNLQHNNSGNVLIAKGGGKIGIGTNLVSNDARVTVDGSIRLTDDSDLFGLDDMKGFNDLKFYGDPIGGPDFMISGSGVAGFGAAHNNVTLNVRDANSSGASTIVFNAELDDGTDVFQVQGDQEVFVIGDFYVNSGSKNFILDHPLDPANKSLAHNAIESPGYVTYYNGTVTLGADGSSVVNLPDYFEALNTNCHYQLTCIGGFAQVYIAEEVSNNQFRIAGGKAGLKVSWQITAERNDPWAREHPYEAELDKTGPNTGKYWYPEGYDQPASMKIGHQKDAAIQD